MIEYFFFGAICALHKQTNIHKKDEISKAQRVILLSNNKIKCIKIGVNVMKR